MPRVDFEQVRAIYSQVCQGVTASNPHDPRPKRIAAVLAESIGLIDKQGRPCEREDGTATLRKDAKYKPSDWHPAVLAEAIIGPRWADVLGLGTPGVGLNFKRLLREEAAAPVGPSHFMNVSAWTAAIGGLIQGQILEGYETAEYDLKGIFPTKPVVFWQGGERLVNIIGPSKMAPEVGPGESHPDVRMDAMWVQPGPVKKYGEKLLITKETVLAKAKGIGDNLAFRENDLTANVIVGSTNNFQLGLLGDSAATGYNTFGATVPTGNGTTGTLGNSLVNPMTDPLTTLQASQTALLQYKHPVTGIPMPFANKLNQVLIPSSLAWFAQFLAGVGQITVGTQPGAPVPAPAGTFPTGWMTSNNPFKGVLQGVRESQWLFVKHTTSATVVDPDIPVGLGLSLPNANRWYRYSKNFAARRVAWEANVIDLNPNDYVMADQGIIAGQVGNMAIMIQVTSPWDIQRNLVA
jgi:hypothetical protein